MKSEPHDSLGAHETHNLCDIGSFQNEIALIICFTVL